MAKRLFDVVVAALGLVAAAPLLLVAAVGIRLSSPGPILYRARLLGRDGRPFTMYKLRTMHLNHRTSRSVITAQHDPRVFAFGRPLRRLKIDELPQLVNVLRGDMSIVGPRPWPVAMVKEQIASGLDYRNHIRAGWTGPAQISKGAATPVSYAELDLVYVRLCRIATPFRLVRYDLGVMLKTIGVMVRGEGLRF